MKLYKYRPLTELLYKELHYQEMYFASYNELNDPLDLSARIDFSCKDKDGLDFLLFLLYKTTITFDKNASEEQNDNSSKLLTFIQNKKQEKTLKNTLHKNLIELQKHKNKIWLEDIEFIVHKTCDALSISFQFNYKNFRNEINKITEKFLQNSYVTCFSEKKDNFLMWSHYASKHMGICLEFTLNESSFFPFIISQKRELNYLKNDERFSEYNLKKLIIDSRTSKVSYQKEQPYINFFNFSHVFQNEHDCDLIGLSKPWTHKYAFELENIFSIKTEPWAYEEEWRIIEINFDKKKSPEDRIRHYPLECLTGVYFGKNTPKNVKERICNILNKEHKSLKYYETIMTKGSMEFQEYLF